MAFLVCRLMWGWITSVRVPFIRIQIGVFPGYLCGKVLCTSCRAINAVSVASGFCLMSTAASSKS